MITTFRDSYISGTSQCLEAASQLRGSFDVFITAASWDRRCISVTKARDINVATALPIYFELRDTLGLRDEHDRLILEYCHRIAGNTTPIKGASRDVHPLWQKIYAELLRVGAEQGRPLRVLLDISTCPRYFSSAIVAVGLTSGLVETVTALYAEATYPEVTGEVEVAFTGGRWHTVPIPGLLGKYKPENTRFYFVSVGFEGWKTLRVVSRADPDRVSVLFPDPGVSPEYPDKAFANNAEIFDHYKIPEEQIVRAHAADAIGAWKALSLSALERGGTENTYLLCCGSKPHSLAFALRALALGYPTVLYNVPDEHKVVQTEPTGRLWKYVIRDTTALPIDVKDA